MIYKDGNLIQLKNSKLLNAPTATFTDYSKKANRKGIDVSYANGVIDRTKVKASGKVDFAIIRAGVGKTKDIPQIHEDSQFRNNIEGALSNGIDVGVYWYTAANNAAEANAEVRYLINLLKNYNVTYPVALDWEVDGKDKNISGHDIKTLTEISKAFLFEINNAGYTPVLYGAGEMFVNHLDMTALSGYGVWLASHNIRPVYDGAFSIWQYSAKGEIDGVYSDYVDLDVWYGEVK